MSFGEIEQDSVRYGEICLDSVIYSILAPGTLKCSLHCMLI